MARAMALAVDAMTWLIAAALLAPVHLPPREHLGSTPSMVSELRRVGGLFKHNFETLRQGKVDPEWGQKQEYALRSLALVLEKISAAYRHDRQES